MADPDWRDSNGNGMSLPDGHMGGKSAPKTLMSGLEGLGLIGPGRTLKNELPTDSDGNTDYLPLQQTIFTWLEETKRESSASPLQMVQGKVSISGGDSAGSIPPEDGGNSTETKDAKHLWNFCNGRLSTMIYNDLMRVKTGGDNSGLADAAIPDGENGAISSVSGNTGTVSTVRGEDAAQTPSTVKRRGKGKGKGGLEKEAWSGCKAYIDKLADREKIVYERELASLRSTKLELERTKLELARDKLELARDRTTRHREEAAGVEDLADTVLRISGAIRGLHSDVDPMVKGTYQELLDDAKEELGLARARKKARKAKLAPATEDD